MEEGGGAIFITSQARLSDSSFAGSAIPPSPKPASQLVRQNPALLALMFCPAELASQSYQSSSADEWWYAKELTHAFENSY